MSGAVHDLLRLVGSGSAMLGIAPDLHIGGPLHAAAHGRAGGDSREAQWLARDGVAGLTAVEEVEVCAALVRAVQGLRARELPAAFVYAFDEAWALGERIRARIAAALGHDYRLIEDVWAWHIPPGSGGWPPHRGIAHALLERDAPEVLNVWIALSDVPADRACMHAVPLDEDPSYPHGLDRLEAPLAAVRALPARAGDALFWNANVLHWGGRCAARATGPRVSCSFTLCRADATARFPDLLPLRPFDTLDLAARMDALARMVTVYGADQPDVSAVTHEWAALTHGLVSRFR